MLLDFEIASCTRRCAVGGRPIAPGERYYSTVHLEGPAAVRRDYAAEAWSGPPEGVLAWWESRMDGSARTSAPLAPQDMLLDAFAGLAEQPAESEFRYVLGLLLLRRRLLKLDSRRTDEKGELLVLDCPRRDEQYELRVAPPADDRAPFVEQRLNDLLIGASPGAARS
ncbi:MAG TPA: hypothetical protein VEQ85_14040 [Lacipirellulaceae bacterium]|nr:hypothetical protein [Lacipirellulaceae bacterium]